MILLMNSTKTMNLQRSPGGPPRSTRPRMLKQAGELTEMLRKLEPGNLAGLLDLNERLADRTRADLARWGKGRPVRRPAAAAFTGLLYKSLDPGSFDTDLWRRAQSRVRILSGLYGLLRPLDQVEAYRLEMGCRLTGGHGANLVAYWKDTLTNALNRDMKSGEPVVSVAALEYVKALDVERLKGPLLQPAFREIRPDGSFKSATVHAKKARGALVRYALEIGAEDASDLLGFHFEEWEAAEEPPEAGQWLFTRPAH